MGILYGPKELFTTCWHNRSSYCRIVLKLISVGLNDTGFGSFPLFYITFNLAEFGIDFSFKNQANSDTNNLFQFGTEYILKQKTKHTTYNLLNSNEIYFNSSKEHYSSTELGASILLYLTNLKFNNHE